MTFHVKYHLTSNMFAEYSLCSIVMDEFIVNFWSIYVKGSTGFCMGLEARNFQVLTVVFATLISVSVLPICKMGIILMEVNTVWSDVLYLPPQGHYDDEFVNT